MMALNVHRGNEFLQSKEYDQALQYFSRVPDDLIPPALYNNIGYIYIMQGKHLEAIGEFDKALAAEPQNKIAHQNLLNVESRFSKAFLVNPGSRQAREKLARARLSLATSHMGRGSLTESRKTLKSALDLTPQGKKLRRLLAERCRKLAEAFTKKRNGRKEARELKNWAAQLD